MPDWPQSWQLITKNNMANNWKKLEEVLIKQDKETAKEPHKMFGECESCGMKTVLVEEVGMCGPCTFGEADTINGNW